MRIDHIAYGLPKIRRFTHRRTCVSCSATLSQYNLNTRCHVCQAKKPDYVLYVERLERKKAEARRKANLLARLVRRENPELSTRYALRKFERMLKS